MREYQERRRLKKLLHSRYAIAGLAILCLIVANSLWGVYAKYRKSQDIVARAATEAATLRAREVSLQQSIAEMGTAEGREREVRDRFGAVKDGERLIVLIDGAASRSPEFPPEEKGWWAKFLSFFGL